jgi:hypothetical protein
MFPQPGECLLRLQQRFGPKDHGKIPPDAAIVMNRRRRQIAEIGDTSRADFDRGGDVVGLRESRREDVPVDGRIGMQVVAPGLHDLRRQPAAHRDEEPALRANAPILDIAECRRNASTEHDRVVIRELRLSRPRDAHILQGAEKDEHQKCRTGTRPSE